MAFNWFNRQFTNSDASKDQSSETDAPQESGKDSEGEATGASEEETTEQVNAKYLDWAKAAYKNFNAQRQAVLGYEEDTEEAESEDEPESEADPIPEPEVGEETLAAETVESESPGDTSETLAIETETLEDTPSDQSDIPAGEADPAPEVQEETLATETADSASPEESSETTVVETETLGIDDVPSEQSDVPVVEVEAVSKSEEDLDTQEAESDAAAVEEKSEPLVAAVPIAEENNLVENKAAEDRVAESGAAEDKAAEDKAANGAGTTIVTAPSELEFDEGFLWSAEVLAAQGRRPDQVSQEEITWLQRLRQGLGKTRRGVVNQLKGVVGQGPLNQDAVMEIESLLLQADVGIDATDYIVESLQARLREDTLPSEEAISYLKGILRDLLDEPLGQEKYSGFYPEKGTFSIWLMTGVNGAGKTTTIGKLAHLAKKSDYRCLIAAADTFRAAAVEQVKVWGERSNVEVVANPGKNTDPAAVVFDAITSAQARDTELLLVDTAGRLQNKKNLMDELGKIRRIVDKKAPDAKIESLLVLDATLGQNGLRQAEVFSQAAQLSGVVLTKLDGSAKGGIALAIVRQLGLPIRFIGAGEGIEDLRPFSSYEFVEALLEG